jgi:hypothetical protein
MPCEPFCYEMDDGEIMVGIMCSKGKPKLCRYCGRPSTSLCDYPIEHSKTCDIAMCNKCKTTIGANVDVCRSHRSKYAIQKTLLKEIR